MKFINSIATFHPYNLSISIKFDSLHKNLDLNHSEFTEYTKIFFSQLQDNDLQEKKIKDFIKVMPKEKQNQVLAHYTSIIHESKHFHDYILSPVGNYAIRRYFTLFAYSIITLMNLSGENNLKTINIPLKHNHNNKEIDELVLLHKKYINNLKELFDTPNDLSNKREEFNFTTNDILESGAVISQYSQIEELMGSKESFDFQQYLNNNERYTKTINSMQRLIAINNKDSGIVSLSNTMLNTLFFTSLCGNNLNNDFDINTQNPSIRLANILRTLFSEFDKIEENNIFEKIEEVAKTYNFISTTQALKENMDLNKNHKKYLEKVLFSNIGEDEPLVKSLLESYDWFLNYNKKITNKFLYDPYCYLNTIRYEKEFLPTMPIPIILEDYSGHNIPLYLKQQIIDKDKVSPILHKNYLHSKLYRNWATIFNRDIDFKPIESLYSYTSNLQFMLFDGVSSNYTRVHPYIFNIMHTSIKEDFLVDLKEYCPYPSKITHKKNMNYLWATEFRNYFCDICSDKIKQKSGYVVYGQELYDNTIWQEVGSENGLNFIEKYHNDFSIYCICDDCYNKLKLNKG